MSKLRIFVLASVVAVQLAVPSLAQDIAGNKADLAFDAAMKTLDLENPTYEFTYKAGKHQGSSIGFHIAEPGHRKSATFAPYNSSNNLESEVVSYRLARFLGLSDIYNPVTYYRLGPLAHARFKAMLRKQTETDPDRRANYAAVVAELKTNPQSLLGIYRLRPRGKRYVAQTLGTANGHLNQDHPLATFIRANGPPPTEKPMSLPGVKGQRDGFPKPSEKASELARQLSDILLVDQLMGQWDRFFNNMEATGDETGRLKLLARDNGGATVDEWEWHDLYVRWVSRYDRPVIEKLRALLAFLQGREKQFAGFDDVEKWKTAVGFLKSGSFNTFKRKLELLVEKKIPALEKQYGNRMYFSAAPTGSAAPSPTPGKI